MKQVKLTTNELSILLEHYKTQLKAAEERRQAATLALREAEAEVNTLMEKINNYSGQSSGQSASSETTTSKTTPKKTTRKTTAPKVSKERVAKAPEPLPVVEMRPGENGAPFAALSMSQKQWRDIIMEILEEKDKPLTNKQIFELANEKLELAEDESKRVKSTIGQALNTLANKKNEVFKHKKQGERGFYYCLPDWFNKQKNLKKAYSKLIK